MGNRVVKFRGKQVDNGEWVYGYYVMHETRQICPIGNDKLKPEEIKHLIVVDSFADWNMPRRLQGIVVIPETVGQYTGLKDKNGKEIYEGDIVAFEDSDGGYEYQDLAINTGIVKYGELGFYFTNRVAVEMDDFYIKDGRCDDVEVIGNIHENPELLEVQE